MNKPIKAKNLPLFSIIDLDQLRREKPSGGHRSDRLFHGKGWKSLSSHGTAVRNTG